jgi:hypothetical protein
VCILTQSFKRETDKKKNVLKQRPAGGRKGGVEIEFFEMNVVVCRRGKEDQKLLGDTNFLEIRERTGLSRADPSVGLGGKFQALCARFGGAQKFVT